MTDGNLTPDEHVKRTMKCLRHTDYFYLEQVNEFRLQVRGIIDCLSKVKSRGQGSFLATTRSAGPDKGGILLL
jgi:hypothetical protein